MAFNTPLPGYAVSTDLYLIYINRNKQISSIKMSSLTSYYGETARDYPNTTDLVQIQSTSPNEDYFPVGFTYHTYNPLRETILPSLSPFFSLWLHQPRLALFISGTFDFDQFLTPKELHIIQNIYDDSVYIPKSIFRLANTPISVFLRVPTI